jgi:hypothetical protein
MCADGRVDSWAYRWTFSCWKHKGVTLLPNNNLVINTGFDSESTHTKGGGESPASVLHPLHRFDPPSSLAADKEADQFTFDHIFTSPAAPDTEVKELRARIKQLKEEIKDCRRALVTATKKADQQQTWARKHPVRAAWRTLRGKFST